MEDLILQTFDKFPVLATVLTTVVAAHAVALLVVNLTPTPKDDAFVKKFYTVVEWVAGIVSAKTKDK